MKMLITKNANEVSKLNVTLETKPATCFGWWQ